MRRIILDKKQRVTVFEPVFLTVFNNHRHLLERTENNHGRVLALFFRFGFQQFRTEVKVFRYVETEIRIEGGFLRQFAFSVLVVTAHIPHRIGSVKVRAEVIRDIRYNQLGLRYVVPFVVLEIVIV